MATLRRVFAGKSSHAAAKAGEIAGEFELSELVPDLEGAFRRFMESPVRRDPGCRAKTEVARALQLIGHDDADLFLTGIRHVQLEPVYGGKADTAADLRGASALGLVRMNHPAVLSELADLLADPEAPARISAARALAYHGGETCAPLLRLKVSFGDDEPAVIAECVRALVIVAPRSSLALVGRVLDSAKPAVVEAVAFALGESRSEGALEVLRAWWERTPDEALRSTALNAIAQLRQDAAFDFLVGLVAAAPGPSAREAIAALGMYRHDDALRKRVVAAAEARDDVGLGGAIREAF